MTTTTSVELRKFVLPEFIYGTGAMNLAGRYARNFGAKKVLVVTDSGVIEAGWTGKILDILKEEGIEYEIFKDVTPNPRDYEVAAGVRIFRETGCDVILAIGGGSPMDCAKGIGIAYSNNMDVRDFEGIDQVPLPGPPLICIPTTAGTSADVSQFAIIGNWEKKKKMAIVTKTVIPDIALIDPETTITMPSELTAATGIDALVHAIEAYVSNASSPFTDLNALAAIPLLSDNLLKAIENPNNMEARNYMMEGSLLAGMAFSNASLGLVHAMAHSLGGLLDLPHGMCNAILLEHVVKFNFSAAPQRYFYIAKAMGLRVDGILPEECCDILVRGISKLREKSGIPAKINLANGRPQNMTQLAINAHDDPCFVTNPRDASVEEIEAIFEKIF
jgi:alcohol dehydrogenase class IV